MKMNPLLASLVGLLLLCAVGTVLLAARHFFAIVELQKLQTEYSNVHNTLTSAQNLANETILYSARNPAITSILEQFKSPGSTLPGAALPPTLTPATINQ